MAAPLPEITGNMLESFLFEQSFRPNFLKLEKAGYSVTRELPDQQCNSAIVFAGRNRRINELNIASAWNRTTENGSIIVAGDKNAGIASLRKWVSAKSDITNSISKYHAMVFEVKRANENWPIPNLICSVEEYKIAEGMFSSDGPDNGSRLLVEEFDNRIKGKVADLGAGWGYLSAELLKRSDNVCELDLFEADYASLDAARQNLPETASCATTFNWIDVTTEFPKKPYDWVIMNPPFHSGRAAEPGLGQRFIEVAASTLPRGGRLLMVANQNLPYERTLEHCFRKFEKTNRTRRFQGDRGG